MTAIVDYIMRMLDIRVLAGDISDGRYVVLDTELTGLDEERDSIVSIGAVRIDRGRISASDTFHTLVRPESRLGRESIVVHGLTPSELNGQADIKEALGRLVRFCGDDVIVGHCLSIDIAFVNRAMRKHLGIGMHSVLVDTFSVHLWLRQRVDSYRELSPKAAELGLYSMARTMGINISGAHDALGDAYITAQVFQRFMHMLKATGVTAVDELARIGDPARVSEGLEPHRGIGGF